jgi:hypothetical protein
VCSWNVWPLPVGGKISVSSMWIKSVSSMWIKSKSCGNHYCTSNCSVSFLHSCTDLGKFHKYKGTEKHMSRLTIGWTVKWWKPGEGEIFHTHPDRSWSLHCHLYNGYQFSFLGVKWPRHGDDHQPPISF